jgi:hypothetical protein
LLSVPAGSHGSVGSEGFVAAAFCAVVTGPSARKRSSDEKTYVLELLLVAAVLAMLPASAAVATNAPTTAASAARVEATLRVTRTSECKSNPLPRRRWL